MLLLSDLIGGMSKCDIHDVVISYASSFQSDICGYFQCATFPRLETGKVVWVLSFDH